MPYPRSLIDSIRLRFPNYIFTMIKPTVDYGPNSAVFRVPLNVNKTMIQNYIEQLYATPVKEVRTMIYQGRTRKSMNGLTIKRPDWKKAIVYLKEPWAFPSVSEQKKIMTKPETIK